MPLVLVGNWDNSDFGKRLRSIYTQSNLWLLDPIYDQQKLNELRSNCKLYVHGHSAGGTNPSLVEAMNLGLPIIAFDVNYNKFTTANKAIYFRSAKDLTDKLNTIDKENQLATVATMMKEIATKEYTWQVISNKYKALFQ